MKRHPLSTIYAGVLATVGMKPSAARARLQDFGIQVSDFTVTNWRAKIAGMKARNEPLPTPAKLIDAATGTSVSMPDPVPAASTQDPPLDTVVIPRHLLAGAITAADDAIKAEAEHFARDPGSAKGTAGIRKACQDYAQLVASAKR